MTSSQLPETEQHRLAQILDDFLVAAENGLSVTPEELLRQHPADAEALRGYLSGLRLLRVAGVGSKASTLPVLASVRAALSGETIGDFRLLREIGRGGMGVVYEAVQSSLRRRVALKVLPMTVAHDSKQISRFRNEAQAAAQLHHPHIVPVFAVGEEAGLHYYAMQLIEGQSLAATLIELRKDSSTLSDATTACQNTRTVGDPIASCPQRSSRALLPPASYEKMTASQTCDHIRTVARLAIEAAEALHAAHEYGVIHRDIKPSNLLVDDNGKLWVTDFGLARCRENAGLTQSGDVLGTMRYMSPEQALGKTTLIDHRTDIYSLGITLYELATLRHPAAGLGDLQFFFDRGRSRCKPLQAWNRHIPKDFQTIVMKSIGEFPHERYVTAREFAEDLRRFLGGMPILASPPRWLNRATKWTKRHRVTVAAVMLVMFAGLIAISLLLAQKNSQMASAYRRSSASLQQAHDVLDRFSTRLVDQLAAIPGAEGVRYQLLEDCLALYAQLETQSLDDRMLNGELAKAYSKMGNLTASMGDKDRALEAHKKAREIWRERLEDDPTEFESQRQLARCNNDMGLLLAELGRNAEALSALNAAYDVQQLLHSKDSHTRDISIELASTCGNLGLVLKQAARPRDAAKRFREAIAMQEKLVETAPGDEAALRNLAAAYNNLASLQESDAAFGFEKAIEIQRRLVQGQSINRNYQSDLARTYNNLGYFSSRMKQWQRAQACYENAIQLQEHLAKTSPLAAVYRRDLAVSYNNLGMVQSQSEQLQAAKAAFRKAFDLQQNLLAVQPNDAQLLSDHGAVLNNLGELLERQQLDSEAKRAFQQAIHIQSKALSAAPTTLAYRELLSNHFYNFADFLRRQGAFDESLEISVQRKQLWPDNPERLLSVAQELAASVEQKPIATDAAERATATLRDAIAAGLPVATLRDSSLSALFDCSEYQQLLSDVSVKDSQRN